MQVETDAERLAMLEGMPGLGSVTATAAAGTFSALFDREYVELSLGGIQVADSSPALLCLESDVDRLAIVRGAALSIEGEGEFVVRVRADRPPNEGKGFTRLFLGKP